MRDARGEEVEMRAVAAFQLSVGESSLICLASIAAKRLNSFILWLL